MEPRVAVLGCGHWGKNLVRNFHALGHLELVCDPSESARTAAQQVAQGVRVAANFDQALKDSSVTAVVIAAPAAIHYGLAKAALEAGKDVFVEKPLCLNVAEGEELVALAERVGKVLMVGHLLQYHPCVQALYTLVAAGDLGKLQYITSNRLNLGKIRSEENALWSFAPHDISVILSLAGSQLPERVQCTGGDYLNHSVADTTLTALKFMNGVRAHVFVSWLNPFKEQKLTVVGSSGLAVFDDTKAWEEKLVVYRQHITWTNGQVPMPNKVKGEPLAVPQSEPLANECQHFIDCCRDRRRPRTDGAEGLRVLTLLQAAQRSLDEDGEPVDLAAPAGGRKPASVTPLPATHRGRGEQVAVPPVAANDYFVHPTAFVDDGAVVGKGTKIWHFCHVMKGASIGEGCSLGQNVNVDSGTEIGNNVKVQNNISIYTGVRIEDDVFLGPSCVFTNVRNPRSQVSRRNLYEKTVVKRGATIGANSTIVCGVTIGKYAFVAAGAVVTRDVPDYALIAGNPARQKGWMSRHGHILKPGKDGIMRCPESGYRYQEIEGKQLRCLDLSEEQPLPPELSRGVKGYAEFK